MTESSRILPTMLLIWLGFIGLYTVMYLGVPLYADELIQFDTAQNLVRRGELVRTYGYDLQQQVITDGAPWLPAAQEPFMAIVIAPLTALGLNVPALGIVHVTTISNIIISALTVASFYAVARRIGWAHRTALIGAVLLGIGTFTWTYSRLLFREPLMAVFTIWAFGLAIELRGHPRDRWRWAAFGLSLVGMALTKVVALLALPGLLIILSPDLATLRRNRRVVLFGLLAVGGLTLVALLASQSALLEGTRYSWSRYENYVRNLSLTSVFESLVGYQVSPARSIWLYAPVLLIGLPGAWSLIRDGRWRWVAAPIITIIAFSIGYGVIHRTVWWGGWSWGPRYFVPLLPVLMLWALPVIDRTTSRLGGLALAMVGGVSIAMQLIGLAVPTTNYYTEQVQLGNTNLFGRGWNWMPANWEVAQSPPLYHLTHIDFAQLNIAWRFAAEPGWLPPLLGLLGALTVTLVLLMRGWLRVPLTVIASGLVFTALTVGMRALEDDPRYIDIWPEGYALAQELNQVTDADHAVLIERGETARTFMNALYAPALVATLGPAPGEDYGQGVSIETDDLSEQAGAVNAQAISYLAETYTDVWLVTGSSPFEPNKRRPIERLLVQYTFPVEEISTGARARAIHFYTGQIASQAEPTQIINATFADVLTLEGYDLPAGTTINAGEVLPVSLAWMPVGTIPFDYHLNLYLAGPDGLPVAQRSGGPQATFGAMTTWPAGERQRDPHGLIVPAATPPGTYTLRLVVYDWRDGSRLTLADGGDTLTLAQITVG